MPKYLIANFDRYHPKAREVTSSARNGNGKLRWVRLDTDWDHDADIAVLPWAERALWPWLVCRAGKGNPSGTVEISMKEVSVLTTLDESSVRHAIRHLIRRGRMTTEGVAGA